MFVAKYAKSHNMTRKDILFLKKRTFTKFLQQNFHPSSNLQEQINIFCEFVQTGSCLKSLKNFIVWLRVSTNYLLKGFGMYAFFFIWYRGGGSHRHIQKYENRVGFTKNNLWSWTIQVHSPLLFFKLRVVDQRSPIASEYYAWFRQVAVSTHLLWRSSLSIFNGDLL